MWRAGWTRGNGPGFPSGRVRSSRARANSPRAEPRACRSGAARAPAVSHRVAEPPEPVAEDLARPFLVGERDADEDQDDEVDPTDRRRVQVAELLADLALDLHPRD